MIASFSLLQPKDLPALLPDLTVFLFPVGGLEQHGPHLPLGTKLFQAETRVRELAKILEMRLPSWNFVLMPLLPLSVDSHTNAIALNVRPHVVRDAFVDQCSELARMGFRNFAVFSSHVTPKQLSAIEDAAKIINRKKILGGGGANLISVSSALIQPKQVFDSPMISLPVEHGGSSDTAFMLKENAHYVDPSFASLSSQPRPRASISRFMQYFQRKLDGYWGTPAAANAEGGDPTLERELHELAEKMLPWLEKGKGQGMFRSGYGYYPFNGSFFKAYLLAAIFFTMMLIWAIWSMKDVFQI